MIGRIRGELIEKSAPLLVVEAHGVGYEILAPMTTIYDIAEVGSQVLLHTHMVVREDAQLLYGFKSKSDRKFFQELIKVNGVGPKMALAILSGMDANTLSHAIINQDVSLLVSIPGIGKKTAERLLVEMKDKIENLVTDTSQVPQNMHSLPDTKSLDVEANEATSALISLGYKQKEAQVAISKIKTQASNAEDMIRLALKSMIK
jgi:Holliday junction DNA helicase RuvA